MKINLLILSMILLVSSNNILALDGNCQVSMPTVYVAVSTGNEAFSKQPIVSGFGYAALLSQPMSNLYYYQLCYNAIGGNLYINWQVTSNSGQQYNLQAQGTAYGNLTCNVGSNNYDWGCEVYNSAANNYMIEFEYLGNN